MSTEDGSATTTTNTWERQTTRRLCSRSGPPCCRHSSPEKSQFLGSGRADKTSRDSSSIMHRPDRIVCVRTPLFPNYFPICISGFKTPDEETRIRKGESGSALLTEQRTPTSITYLDDVIFITERNANDSPFILKTFFSSFPYHHLSILVPFVPPVVRFWTHIF